eukprot:scaffold24831_cov132-Isochrysis_galbana.AAC.1
MSPAPRLGHRVGTGTCGPAQGPPDPVMGSALWRPGHRIMKKKLKKNLGASSAPALAREGGKCIHHKAGPTQEKHRRKRPVGSQWEP